MEETGLKVVDIAFLFEFTGRIHRDTRGGSFRNTHKVFTVSATGVAEPRREIKRVAYHNGSELKISHSARKIVENIIQ